jgi:hypothetical protein
MSTVVFYDHSLHIPSWVVEHTSRGYSPTRRQAGWVKSAVFDKQFRLTRQIDEQGNPTYDLEMR